MNGHTYQVQSDFRTALGYIRLLGDEETSDEDKTLLGLSMFFGDHIDPLDVRGLAEFISWFVRRGKEPERGVEKRKRLFDIIADSGRIYAAFFQTYHINLRQVRMHWWIFGELLEGLPKSTHLSDVIEIRGRVPEKWMKPADKLALARMQDYYKLEDNPSEIMDGLFNSLLGISG